MYQNIIIHIWILFIVKTVQYFYMIVIHIFLAIMIYWNQSFNNLIFHSFILCIKAWSTFLLIVIILNISNTMLTLFLAKIISFTFTYIHPFPLLQISSWRCTFHRLHPWWWRAQEGGGGAGGMGTTPVLPTPCLLSDSGGTR